MLYSQHTEQRATEELDLTTTTTDNEEQMESSIDQEDDVASGTDHELRETHDDITTVIIGLEPIKRSTSVQLTHCKAQLTIMKRV